MLARDIAALGLLLIAGPSLGAGAMLEFVTASESSFSRPHDVTLGPDGRYLYVADLGNDVVKVLDAQSLRTLGAIGKNELAAPHDVAFDAAGRLLVADTGNDRIAIYRVDGVKGSYVGELREGLSSPEGVTTGPGEKVYVTNVRSSEVVVFTQGKRSASRGEHGSGPGQYSSPHDIELGPDNRLYVADPGNNRVQVLNTDLKVLGELTQDFRDPKYLALDEQGWLYVGDQFNHQVKIFDRDRKLVATIGTGKRGSGIGEFNGLEGVEVKRPYVWVADTYNNRIVLYRWLNP